MNENQKAQVLDTLKAIKDTTDKERAEYIDQLKKTLTQWNETGPDGWAAAVKEALEATGEAALKPLAVWVNTERDRKGGPVTARTDWTAKPGPRQWLVEGWLPAGRVALLSGQGGAGKSRLALQLALALVERRKNWLPDGPDLVDSGPAVIATWEDEPDEITRRLRGMVGIPDRLEALKDKLHVLDFAGKGAFWQPPAESSRHTSTMGELTPAGEWTRAYCETHKAKLLVVDPLAAAYACNENDRGLVRAFMTSWDGWARETGCAVLIVSHPAKAAESDYSGSTDWHAAARAVWKLGTEDTGLGESNKKANAPRLDCLKNSYGTPNRQYWLSGWPAWEGRGRTTGGRGSREFQGQVPGGRRQSSGCGRLGA